MVTLYSIGCDNCNKLELELNRANIEYTVVDDIDKMRKMGFTRYPILEVDNTLMNFERAMDWIDENRG